MDVGNSKLGNDPKRTASLRSLWNVTPTVELDVAVRYMGELPAPVVPAYTVADVRIGRRVTPRVDLSLLVADAFDREHREFAGSDVAVLGRGTFLKATWRP